jgi:hypothetical protein
MFVLMLGQGEFRMIIQGYGWRLEVGRWQRSPTAALSTWSKNTNLGQIYTNEQTNYRYTFDTSKQKI